MNFSATFNSTANGWECVITFTETGDTFHGFGQSPEDALGYALSDAESGMVWNYS